MTNPDQSPGISRPAVETDQAIAWKDAGYEGRSRYPNSRIESGMRESNPRMNLGKVPGYHYINPATSPESYSHQASDFNGNLAELDRETSGLWAF